MNLKHRRKVHHQSFKSGLVYCDSSYEIKAATILDADPNVLSYETHTGFYNANGKKRIIDFLVTYKNGSKKLIEVKPFRRIEQFTEQIEDNKNYSAQNNYEFAIWTEDQLGLGTVEK